MEGAQPKQVHFFVLMVAMVGNSVVWGMGGFMQFHAQMPVSDGGYGLGVFQIGIIFGISACFGAVANIFWGAISDRTTSKWGKRKPFMFIFPPLVLIATWASASVDILFGVQAIFITFLIIWTVKGVLHSGANVPYSTVIPEVVPPEKRVLISQFSAFIQGIGLVIGAIVPTLLFSFFNVFSIPFLIAGVILVFFYLVSSTAIPPSAKAVKAEKFFYSIRVTFRDHNFMVFQFAQFLWTLALNVFLFIIPFLAYTVIGIQSESTFGWFYISFIFIAGVMLLLLKYIMLKRNAKKKKTFMASLLLTAIALPFLGFIGTRVYSGIPILVQVYLFGTLVFAGLAGLLILPYAIFMSLIDYDSGSEATYNGANNAIASLAAIPSGPIGGFLVTMGYPYVGFVCALLIILSMVLMMRVNIPEHLFQKRSLESSV